MLKNRRNIILLFVILILLVIAVAILFIPDNKTHVEYKTFKEKVLSGDVVEASVNSKDIIFSLKEKSGDYYTDNPGNPDLKEFLLLNDVKLVDKFSQDTLGTMFDVLFYIFFFAIAIFAIKQFSGMFGGAKFKVIRKNKTKFDNICGMDNIKEDMRALVDMLKSPNIAKEKGVRLPKGIILEGPPGNGKTLFAKALSGEANINFIPSKGADFQSAVMSVGPNKIKALFKKARRNKPCILFIDEFDSIGERRNYTGTGIDKENNRIITAMLNEMDGFESEEGVLVIGATNSYASLDAALIRPGRFDLKYNIGNPDKQTIIELINMYTKNKKLSPKINIESLAKCFNGISCSAVETLCNEAAFEASRQGREIIELEDFIVAGRKTNIIKINKV